MKTYHVGTLAYLDTMRGLVPCKVIAVKEPSDGHHFTETVTVRVTATRPLYKRGEVVNRWAPSVIPRSHVFTQGFQYRVRKGYRWAP